jgi:hypothetical protein
MSKCVAIRIFGVALTMALVAPFAIGYILNPPMTLQKMCMMSHHIRVLKVEKHNKEKGVIVFEVTESLQGQDSQITSFKHVIRTEAAGVKPILEWVGDGKTAVMFAIESKPPFKAVGIGYVFIDKYCYSVDFNNSGKVWVLLRAEPDMSACYHGPAGNLKEIVKSILDGKKNIEIPVKEPDTKEDREKRKKEIDDLLKKNKSS